MAGMVWSDALLSALATARLSRVVTTDEIGEHYVQAPTRAWLKRIDAPEWVADGLDCPFCVGFWLGAAVLVSHSVAGLDRRALAVWRLGTAALAMNYVVGHLSSRLD